MGFHSYVLWLSETPPCMRGARDSPVTLLLSVVRDTACIPLFRYPAAQRCQRSFRYTTAIFLRFAAQGMEIELEITAITLCSVVPLLVPVTARTKMWVCGRSLTGNDGSNPARNIDVCCECCVLVGRSLCVGLIALSYVWVWSWNLVNDKLLTH